MYPTATEIHAARRAMKAIALHQNPSQADALMLRLWSKPREVLRPLKAIAQELLAQTREFPEAPTQS
jgi:hypothetical protein